MAEETQKTNQYSELWENVRRELQKRDMSANKVAVLETEKIFRNALQDRNIPFKDPGKDLGDYAGLFSNYDKLRYSRAMYEKLITKPGFDISEEDTREIIRGYRDAVLDLEKTDFGKFPIIKKARLFLDRAYSDFPKGIRKLAAILVFLSISTFILTETEKGKVFSAYIVSINDYIFYKIIPAIIILTFISAAALVILYSYRKKKK